MNILKQDRDIILPLAEEVGSVASLPEQKERIARWKRLNALKPVRPLVYADEIPWHEMDADGSLRIKSVHPTAQRLETQLRHTLYRWKHMPLDMVVDDTADYRMEIRDDSFGVHIEQDILPTDVSNSVVSHHYKPVVTRMEDLEKVKFSEVVFSASKTREEKERTEYLLGGALRAVPAPAFGLGYFGPLDHLACWMGVQELLTAIAAEPELVHAFLHRMTEVWLDKYRQYEHLGLLAPNSHLSRDRIGTGGLGYTDELPPMDNGGRHTNAQDMWGAAAAQVFSEVSPRMHEEFALEYECRYLSMFGLTYYGCCDPLHRKIELLDRRIPNLRKISISPWADVAHSAEKIGPKFVMSLKPNPAVFAYDDFRLGLARKELEDNLAAARTCGCAVEVIIKDISTVRYEPRRLWDWAAMAMETVSKYET